MGTTAAADKVPLYPMLKQQWMLGMQRVVQYQGTRLDAVLVDVELALVAVVSGVLENPVAEVTLEGVRRQPKEVLRQSVRMARMLYRAQIPHGRVVLDPDAGSPMKQ